MFQIIERTLIAFFSQLHYHVFILFPMLTYARKNFDQNNSHQSYTMHLFLDSSPVFRAIYVQTLLSNASLNFGRKLDARFKWPVESYLMPASPTPVGHPMSPSVNQGILVVTNLDVSTSAVPNWPGHTAEVIHLQFSSTDLLPSASVDRTVRLWHPFMAHFLQRIPHADMVTSVAFHITNDNLRNGFFSEQCNRR